MKKISLSSTFIALVLANSFANAQDSPTTILDEVKVTSKKEIGATSSIGGDTIEKRNTNNIADLLNQTSEISLNGLYQRPDISVEIQGLGGHGRVSQSLEGIQQNFEAFGHNFKQSGTILVNPAFLKSIDIKKGATTDASSIGNLAGSANFKYFDVNDIVKNGKNYGGLLKFSTGISKYSNGQEPSGSAIVGAKGDKWEFLVGLSKSENKNYHMGKNISTSKYVKNSDSIQWGGIGISEAYIDKKGNLMYRSILGEYDFIHRGKDDGTDGSIGSSEAIAKGNPLIIENMKSAAKNSVSPGTFRKTESGMTKFRYFIDDEQTINLFATKTKAHYQSDVGIKLIKNLDGTSEFIESGFYVDTKLDSDIISSNYQASFSEFLNPSITLFYERMRRDQFWPNPYGGKLEVVDKFYSKIEDNSVGLRVDNTSYFDDTYVGSIKFNIGMEYKKLNHKANDYTLTHAQNQYVFDKEDISQGAAFNPNSDSDTYAASMALSSDYEDTNPWKWNISTGVKRVFLDVHNPSIYEGTVTKAGTIYLGYKHFMPAGLTGMDEKYWLRGKGDQASYQAWQEYKNSGSFKQSWLDSRKLNTNKKHSWTLKAANADLQYTIPNTSLTIYTQGSYGQRAPSVSELYMHGYYYKGLMGQNSYLEPEKNLSLQAGLNYQKSDFFSNDDFISLNANLYRNKIDNYILMAYSNANNHAIDYNNGRGSGSGYGDTLTKFTDMSYTNNTEDWITKGLGIDFSYSQSSFYINGNMTVPFKKKNKVCYDEFPGGKGYYKSTDTDGTITYTSAGTGRHVCGNSYKWASFQTIEPFQASLTAAITPLNGDLELGTTLHYRGKQKSYLNITEANKDVTGKSPYKVGDMAEVKRFPDVLKFDLFANYKVTKALKVGVYVANITDQLDMMPFSEYATVLPGRTITASLEYRF
ncbi:TonB-dependent receptor domain-containing protein [Aliarcobacter lanthieri]|uniref:TonB-dependent receptor domain-containing protein n=1 Tax=Aliarcobacter lanthieri TaxID=1355374 RepID=UPI0004798715|nr:TonB-dependent receptor [Aliarcobacter lanthieri]QKF60022.1 TonB-dependent receptor [Aliarcobacter lanthieri]